MTFKKGIFLVGWARKMWGNDSNFKKIMELRKIIIIAFGLTRKLGEKIPSQLKASSLSNLPF